MSRRHFGTSAEVSRIFTVVPVPKCLRSEVSIQCVHLNLFIPKTIHIWCYHVGPVCRGGVWCCYRLSDWWSGGMSKGVGRWDGGGKRGSRVTNWVQMSVTISCTWAEQSTDQTTLDITGVSAWVSFTTIRLLIWMAVACEGWQRPQECGTPCTLPLIVVVGH